MKLRHAQFLVMLIALAALALALRQDLSAYALQRGEARLLAGDVPGAEAAFRMAVTLGGDPALPAYNLGVGLYGKGAYSQAQRQFTGALASAGPGLAAAAHYNRGNSLFRQAERLAASDRQTAGRLFQAAVADYHKALALAPGAVDVGGNLELAQARLVALGNTPGQDAGNRKTGEGAAKPSATETGTGQQTGARETSVQPGSSRQKAAGSSAARSESPEGEASSGKSRRDLTRTEAERLLNEARGREKLAGMPHGGNPNRPQAKPDKDW